MFLKISQNLQENTCVGVSFFNKVSGLRPATLSKKRLWHKCSPMNFATFLEKEFFYRTLSVACTGAKRVGVMGSNIWQKINSH